MPAEELFNKEERRQIQTQTGSPQHASPRQSRRSLPRRALEAERPGFALAERNLALVLKELNMKASFSFFFFFWSFVFITRITGSSPVVNVFIYFFP